jgi:hypothetical protein
MDRSTLDDGYLTRRGFHWYAYDPASNNFPDLSAREPGGSAGAGWSARRDRCLLTRRDRRPCVLGDPQVAAPRVCRTDILGRPGSYDQPFVYTGRVMWVDSRGRLYFTASTQKSVSVRARLLL